jgi:hypothetical protein
VPTLDVPASATTARGQTVAIPSVTVTANSAANVQEQLSVTHGMLTMTTLTGLTFTTGDGTADAEMQFSGTPTNVQNALNTLSFTPTASYVGSAALTYKTTPGGGLYNPDNGHFYQFIDNGTNISWTNAKIAAAATTFGSLTGYLATVTSSAEQTFVQSKLNGQGWFGASDDAGQGASESHWYWATGPEAGTNFWNGTYSSGTTCGTAPCTAVSGLYNNWSSGEPNNAGGENYAHFLTNGKWNDFPNSNGITKYLVEFGGQNCDADLTDSDTTALSVTAVAPAAPTSGSLTVDNAQLGVGWSAPADNGGAAIDNYLVEYRVSGGSWTSFGTTTSTSATITGLTNGTSYDVRVSAHNAIGYGATASMGTATPITTATAVQGLAAAVENVQSTVSWTVPTSDGGSTITGYKVEYSTDGSTWTVATASTVSPYVITGLTNGTTYAVRVTPINGAGAGAALTTSVTPGTTATSPQSVAAASGDEFATVTWTAPTSDGGHAIVSYKVEYSTDGSSWTTASAMATSPYVLTGLTNGTEYQVRVSAGNDIGTGTSSTATVTPLSIPSAPVNVLASPSTTGILVSWAAPADIGGTPITSYKLEYRTGSDAWTTVSSTATSPATIGGLVPGTQYDVRVIATNAVGEGPAAATSTTTIVPPAPGTSAPVFLTPNGTVVTVPVVPTGPVAPVAIASTSTGQGSWSVTPDGGVFNAGDAGFFGSMGGQSLVAPAVGIAPTTTGDGYYVVASDGGVFAFGDASFKGSMAGKPLNQSMLGIVDECGADGYWLYAADGGVFTFGDAKFYGSLGSNPPKGGVIGMVSAPDGQGYWLIGADKHAYGFGSVAN